MINLVCENCKTKYKMDFSCHNAGKKKIKCARCNHQWDFYWEGSLSNEHTTSHDSPNTNNNNSLAVKEQFDKSALYDNLSLNQKIKEYFKKQQKIQIKKHSCVIFSSLILIVLIIIIVSFDNLPNIVHNNITESCHKINKHFSDSKGLALSNIQYQYDENNHLKLTGNLVNTSDMDRNIPLMKLVINHHHKPSTHSIIFQNNHNIITPNQSINFSYIIDQNDIESIELDISNQLKILLQKYLMKL